MRISEIANIQAGFQFRGKIEPDDLGNVSIVQIKDIEDRQRLNTATVDRIRFDRPYDAYLISRGDVLFLSRGHRLFAVAVEDDLHDAIAAGYFYILRLKTGQLHPRFLAWYINQPPFQAKLAELSQGTHMPFVSKAQFQELSVPIPPQEIQHAIVALSELAEQEQSILTQLAEKRAVLIQSHTLAAAAGAQPLAMTASH